MSVLFILKLINLALFLNHYLTKLVNERDLSCPSHPDMTDQAVFQVYCHKNKHNLAISELLKLTWENYFVKMLFFCAIV